MLLTIGTLSGLLLAERLDRGDADPLAAASRAAEVERGFQAQLAARLAELEDLRPDSALRAELASLARPDYRSEPGLGGVAASNERLVIETMAIEYQAKLEVVEHILDRLRAAEDATLARQSRSDSSRQPQLQRL